MDCVCPWGNISSCRMIILGFGFLTKKLEDIRSKIFLKGPGKTWDFCGKQGYIKDRTVSFGLWIVVRSFLARPRIYIV